MAFAVLETQGVSKSFGGVHAVRDVDFQLNSGRIHALLGENGAGKSTFVGMLSGMLSPDGGEVLMGGERITLASPQDAHQRGLRTVHQELELAGPLSVSENILLGALPSRFGVIDRQQQRTSALEVLNRLGADLDPDGLVEDLTVADQQLVEIARAIAAKPQVLFLDEPTAALPPPEIERLLAVLKTLKAQGVAILYISHRLDEVLQIADDITVLRDGAVAFSQPNEGLDHRTIVGAMLGEELSAGVPIQSHNSGKAAIAISGLSAGTTLFDADFNVEHSEIVGFFGLAGSGHSEIASALFGITKAKCTEAKVKQLSRLPRSPREAISMGFAYVPADRKMEGLALGLSVSDNLLMTVQAKLAKLGIRDMRAERSLTSTLIERYRIKVASVRVPVSSLSGGNQQKVVLGRTVSTGLTDTLLLCEPTRGVDVGAKAEIYRLLRAFVAEGSLGLLFSSDADEVAAVCDRVYVLRRGRIVSMLRTGEFTPNSLIAQAL